MVQIENYPVELVYYRQPENQHENLPASHKSRIVEVNNWNQFYVYLQTLKRIHEAICWGYNLENKYSNIAKIFAYYRSLNQSQLAELLNKYSKNG